MGRSSGRGLRDHPGSIFPQRLTVEHRTGGLPGKQAGRLAGVGAILGVVALPLILMACQTDRSSVTRQRTPTTRQQTPAPTGQVLIPNVTIQLPDNPRGYYCTGDLVPLRILANQPGLVELLAVDEHAQRQSLYAGQADGAQPLSYDWQAPGTPGPWFLFASLNNELATDTKSLEVRADEAAPTIEALPNELKARANDGTARAVASICPGDEVWVRAAVIDDCQVEAVQLWTRQRSCDPWNKVDMEAVSAQEYRSALTAPAEPGIQYLFYAHDRFGREQMTAEQTLAFERCYLVVYDLVAQAPQATWIFYYSEAITETYTEASAHPADYTMGRVQILNSATIEGGQAVSDVLLTNPPWIVQGIVAGRYRIDSIEIQEGDYLFARIGFLDGSYRGDAFFNVLLEPDTMGAPTPSPVERSSARSRIGGLGPGAITMISVRDHADPQRWEQERIKTIIVPLPTYVPPEYLYLVVDNGSTAFTDRAVWIDAEIRRPID